jgi:hypothetical protein
MDVLGAPAGVQGVDELGAVEVTLAADGLPQRIRPLAGWAQAARAERAGLAIGEAFATAHRVHVAATAAQAAAAAQHIPPEPMARPAGAWGSGRELLELAEHAVARLGSGPPVGVGRSAAAPVTITLTPPSGLRCTLDERWIAVVGPAQAETALAEALAVARRDLSAAVAERASAAAALDDLVGAMIEQLRTLPRRA